MKRRVAVHPFRVERNNAARPTRWKPEDQHRPLTVADDQRLGIEKHQAMRLPQVRRMDLDDIPQRDGPSARRKIHVDVDKKASPRLETGDGQTPVIRREFHVLRSARRCEGAPDIVGCRERKLRDRVGVQVGTWRPDGSHRRDDSAILTRFAAEAIQTTIIPPA